MNKTRVIEHARSDNNGITIFSTQEPLVAVKTFYDENNKIKSAIIFGSSSMDSINASIDYGVKNSTFYMANFLAIVVGIVLTAFTNNLFYLISAITFIVKDMFMNFEVLFRAIWYHKTPNGIRRQASRYHAAEHKAINIYNKTHKVPTFAEIKKASRISKNCGSTIIFNDIFEDILTIIGIAIVFFVLLPEVDSVYKWLSKFQLPKYSYYGAALGIFLFITIAYITVFYSLLIIVRKFKLVRFMQVFVTEEPTDREIYLAIEAIKNFEQMEKIYEEYGLEGLNIKAIFSSNKVIIFK